MDVEEFLALTDDRGRPPSERTIRSFEKEIGTTLPSEYRDFLQRCNGGYVGGAIWFAGSPGGADLVRAGVQHVGGLRRDEDYSLRANRKSYQIDNKWIPTELLWVMDDPFGNATCIGIAGVHRNKVYFWDHEAVPGDGRDGRAETADNIRLLAPSFSAFLAGCQEDTA